jgi:hypothetical protein
MPDSCRGSLERGCLYLRECAGYERLCVTGHMQKRWAGRRSEIVKPPWLTMVSLRVDTHGVLDTYLAMKRTELTSFMKCIAPPQHALLESNMSKKKKDYFFLAWPVYLPKIPHSIYLSI